MRPPFMCQFVGDNGFNLTVGIDRDYRMRAVFAKRWRTPVPNGDRSALPTAEKWISLLAIRLRRLTDDIGYPLAPSGAWSQRSLPLVSEPTA